MELEEPWQEEIRHTQARLLVGGIGVMVSGFIFLLATVFGISAVNMHSGIISFVTAFLLPWQRYRVRGAFEDV
jgi:phosphotransferase system  glucose/maltose/N-acetylglucosamine-specific IIC component